jgi:predicted porin
LPSRLAVAFATLAVAGVVDAQSNVTLYGRLNLDVEGVRGRAPNGNDDWTARLSSNSSRFGVRGSESLGGGISAVFQIETSISADAGGGTLAGRDTYVGLQGAWGTLRFGNIKTPYDLVNSVFGNVPTFTSSILDTESVWGNGSSLANGGFPYRAPNSVRYDLPGRYLEGINAGFNYSMGEGCSSCATYTFGGIWQPEPWSIGAVYQYNHRTRDTATVTGLKDHAWSVALGYKFFGAYRFAVVFEQIDYDTPTGSLKRDFWGVSTTIDIGAGQLYAFYGNASDGKGGAANGERVGGLAKGADTSTDHYEISYTYPLSKRTSVYTGYVKIDNDANASYNFATNPIPLAIGGKPEGFLLGLMHNF